jgi:hypothetical protein
VSAVRLGEVHGDVAGRRLARAHRPREALDDLVGLALDRDPVLLGVGRGPPVT